MTTTTTSGTTTSTDTVRVVVDGVPVEVPVGSSILDAAHLAGRRIPTLCHHPDLPDVGICRVCLVEVVGQRALQASCAYPITEPVEIRTYSRPRRGPRGFGRPPPAPRSWAR